MLTQDGKKFQLQIWKKMYDDMEIDQAPYAFHSQKAPSSLYFTLREKAESTTSVAAFTYNKRNPSVFNYNCY